MPICCKCVFITYINKICKIVLKFFIMCAVKPCHLVPKYLFRKGDLHNRKKPESYCLPTTCGTSHEGYTMHIDSCQNKTKNGCMNVSKYNTRPNILFFVLMQGTFYCQQVKNKKGSFLQLNHIDVIFAPPIFIPITLIIFGNIVIYLSQEIQFYR